MKQFYICSYCEEEVDTHKRAFVYSPKSDDCIHLNCFIRNITGEVSMGVRRILKDEDEHRKKKWKKEKVKNLIH